MQEQDENNKEIIEDNDKTFDETKKVEVMEKNNSIEDVEVKKEKVKDTVELQEEEYNKKKKKKKKIIKIIVIISVILLMLLIFSMIFAVTNLNSDKIISGVSINGIEMSGLSKEEAKGKLETLLVEKKKKQILLKYNDYETEINPELIEVNYDLDGLVEKAYNVGRDSNIFVNNYSILFTLIGKKDIKIEATFNQEQLEKALQDSSSKLPGAIKEPSYYIEDDNLIITKGTPGIAIDIEETTNKIKEILNDITNTKDDYIQLKVVDKTPKAIDIDAIYKEVHTEAKDAYYVKDPFQIFPEVNGIDFNVEQAKELLKEDKNEYTIKLTITPAKVTVNEIGTEAFPDKLAHFTTIYDAGNVNRTTNLRLACQKINGKVLLPDEVFSYNKVVGERTIAAGYKEAKIYSAGQVVDGLGGGICQISSTLYNAVLRANLQIVERRNHQFVTSYLPAGRDATVVYGATDFQFKNTRKYPIRLVANVQNGIATVDIFGIKEEEEYSIELETRTIATLPFSTQYVDDASLEAGKEVVTQKGANGLQTETYIIKSLNGKVVSKNLLTKDTYTPMQRIVKRSTKTAEPTPQPAPEPSNPAPAAPTPEPVPTPKPEPIPEPTPTPEPNPTSQPEPGNSEGN